MENRLFPMRELLGYLLLELHEPAQAFHEFEASLKATPNRLRGWYGVAKAAELAHKPEQATAYYRKLLALGQQAETERIELRAAKAYVTENAIQ